MRKHFQSCHSAFLAVLLVILLFLSYGSFSTAQSTPPYARQGAYALYDAYGGFIPFFDGVSGNLSYTVNNLYSNGTMLVVINGNVSQGSEAPMSNVSVVSIDSVEQPKVFPAVPPSMLSNSWILFFQTNCSRLGTRTIDVEAGYFNTVEYQGKGPNGTVNYWFDQVTGLAVELSGNGGALQLISSNFATPSGQGNWLSNDLPVVEAFGIFWAVAGLLFYGVWRYYRVKGQKRLEEMQQQVPRKGKGRWKSAH